MEYLDRIKKLRSKRGITQAEMSKRLGMAQNNYGKLERGITEMTVKRLLDIADILDVTLDDIFYSDRVSETSEKYIRYLEVLIENRDFFVDTFHKRIVELTNEVNGFIRELNKQEKDKELHYKLHPMIPSLKSLGFEKHESILESDN